MICFLCIYIRLVSLIVIVKSIGDYSISERNYYFYNFLRTDTEKIEYAECSLLCVRELMLSQDSVYLNNSTFQLVFKFKLSITYINGKFNIILCNHFSRLYNGCCMKMECNTDF